MASIGRVVLKQKLALKSTVLCPRIGGRVMAVPDTKRKLKRIEFGQAGKQESDRHLGAVQVSCCIRQAGQRP